MSDLPVFGICGYSGSGKTTLIEAMIPGLKARCLRVAVVKHDCHGLQIDCPGKDSDRFFNAGADVLSQGPGQAFFRIHGPQDRLSEMLPHLCRRYDLVLVEGHKTSPLPHKVWLLGDKETSPPREAGQLEHALARDADRLKIVSGWIQDHLAKIWRRVPLYAGILVGGKASRMGGSKHLNQFGGRTWMEQIVKTVAPFVSEVICAGKNRLPESLQGLPAIPDAPGVPGPLAGMLSAMRWNPWASWLFVACDMPAISEAALHWLLAEPRPGIWATLPRLEKGNGVEPLLAHYDFRSGALLEFCRCPADIVRWPQVATPVVPAELEKAWQNINTPEDLVALSSESRG